MLKSNMALIGMMGSGKSFSSNRLGQLLKKDVVSTDKYIEEKEGRAISKIFEDSGEAYFRQLEKQIVKEVSGKKDVIIDCGGGVVLDQENVKTIKQNAVIFYLSATAEVLLKQIKLTGKEKRPLLNVNDPLGKLKEMLTTRKPLYEQAADYVIDANNKTIEEISQNILKIWKGITNE